MFADSELTGWVLVSAGTSLLAVALPPRAARAAQAAGAGAQQSGPRAARTRDRLAPLLPRALPSAARRPLHLVSEARGRTQPHAKPAHHSG